MPRRTRALPERASPFSRRFLPLVGFAESDPELPARLAAFRRGLERLGWKEGHSVRIEYRWGAGDPTRMRAHAKELMGTSPDVLVTESTPATAALQSETRATPIVFLQAGNPVGSGFATSFARPGGNLTGFTNYAPTMGGKWLELLKEVVPRLVRAAALFNPKTHTGQYWAVLEAAAQTVNVQFAKAAVADAAEIERAVEVMSGQPSGGLLVMPDSFTMSHQETIVAWPRGTACPRSTPFARSPRAADGQDGAMRCGWSPRMRAIVGRGGRPPASNSASNVSGI